MCYLELVRFTESNIVVTADENSQEEDEKREDEYFQKMYQQWKGMKAKDDSTYKVIPKFYFKVLLASCISYATLKYISYCTS